MLVNNNSIKSIENPPDVKFVSQMRNRNLTKHRSRFYDLKPSARTILIHQNDSEDKFTGTHPAISVSKG